MKYFHIDANSKHCNENIVVFSRGEYLCPLCRQLANSVLPLSPQLGDKAQMVRSRPSSMKNVLDEISDFLKENDQKPVNIYLKKNFYTK